MIFTPYCRNCLYLKACRPDSTPLSDSFNNTQVGQFLDVLETCDGSQLAYHHLAGAGPGVLFCGGFNSNMQGNKALFLESLCRASGWQFTRFDYRGHGESSGEFSQGNISLWLDDALSIIDTVCTGPQIIVGSSMGAWIATLVCMARPQACSGLLGIAAAADFTEELIWNRLDMGTKKALRSGDTWEMPNHYEVGSSHQITFQLIESGTKHLVLQNRIPVACPVRLLHGLADTDVPADTSIRLQAQLDSEDVHLLLIKNADHRFSTAEQLALIETQLRSLHQLTCCEI